MKNFLKIVGLIIAILFVLAAIIIGFFMFTVGGDLVETAEKRVCYDLYIEQNGLSSESVDIEAPEVVAFTKECAEKRLYNGE